MTPPNQSPSSDEKGKFKDKDVFDKGGIIPIAAKIYKIVYWGNFICESVVILANHFPSSTSTDILRLLSRSPSRAQHISSTPIWLAGCALMCLGGGIRLICYRTLGKFFTWQLAVKKDHALITNGPYSIVRHPSYVGSVLLAAGTILTHFGPGGWYHECIGLESWGSRLFAAAWGGWTAWVAVVLLSRVPTEDAILRKEFGAEWEAWARRTPYKLIPYIY